MNALETIHVSSRGQIVIPEGMRKSMKLKQGAKLVILQQGERIILQTEESFLARMAGKHVKHAPVAHTLGHDWAAPSDDATWNRF